MPQGTPFGVQQKIDSQRTWRCLFYLTISEGNYLIIKRFQINGVQKNICSHVVTLRLSGGGGGGRVGSQVLFQESSELSKYFNSKISTFSGRNMRMLLSTLKFKKIIQIRSNNLGGYKEIHIIFQAVSMEGRYAIFINPKYL